MGQRKVLNLDAKADQAITELCDVSLKAEGLKFLANVNLIKKSVQRRKFIVFDEDMDSKLGLICGAALKNLGSEVLDDVNLIIDSISEESVSDDVDSVFKQ